MKRSNVVALLALAVLTVLVGFSQADALQSLKTSKLVVITVVVTPSPAPMGMLRPAAPAAAIAARPAIAFAHLADDPFAGPRQIASSGSAWDVAPGAGPMIAQVTPVQPPPVPVQFNAKPDPNSVYLHVIQHTPELDVPYGTTVFPCAFEVYTFYDKATYALNDYGQGTEQERHGSLSDLQLPGEQRAVVGDARLLADLPRVLELRRTR